MLVTTGLATTVSSFVPTPAPPLLVVTVTSKDWEDPDGVGGLNDTVSEVAVAAVTVAVVLPIFTVSLALTGSKFEPVIVAPIGTELWAIEFGAMLATIGKAACPEDCPPIDRSRTSSSWTTNPCDLRL